MLALLDWPLSRCLPSSTLAVGWYVPMSLQFTNAFNHVDNRPQALGREVGRPESQSTHVCITHGFEQVKLCVDPCGGLVVKEIARADTEERGKRLDDVDRGIG